MRDFRKEWNQIWFLGFRQAAEKNVFIKLDKRDQASFRGK